MRSPDRIPRLLAKLGRLWKQKPDLRLGQLVVNLAHDATGGEQKDPFNVEDDQMEKVLDGWLDEPIQCFKCLKSYRRESGNDCFEAQEFLTFSQRGGYGSIFGDGNKVSVQLCQRCTKELLGPYLKIVEGVWWDAAVDEAGKTIQDPTVTGSG